MRVCYSLFHFTIPVLLLFSVLCSCKKTKSLAELRKEERQAINEFIRNGNIEVITAFPPDTVFLENQYYHDSTGLYIHVVDKGYGGVPVKGDEIVVNYYEITMSGDTTQRYWSPTDYGFSAPSFTYQTNYTIAGFNTAVGYLQHEGEAELILPSEIGTSDALNSVTPYRYRIRIKIKG